MRIFTLIIIGFLAAGCGSDSDSNTPTSRPAGTLVGVAHDAPMINTDIKIYDWSSGSKGDLLAETTTDATGDYSIELISADKPVLIVAGDEGSYIEEASGQVINLEYGQNISAVTNYESGETLDLQITPFTHLAQCYATYLVSEGIAVQDALNLANSKIAGVAGVDIIGTKPLDVTSPNNANVQLTPGLKYGFLTAGISELMIDAAEANGLPAHSHSFLTSIQWSKVACNDISADGLLDGTGFISGNTTGQLAFGTYLITADTYRTLLAQRMLSFALSDNNKTGLGINELLVSANALSTNTDSVWAGQPGQPVDTTGPVIGADIADNSYIGGYSSNIPFSISDPVGVGTVDFYVDNALVSSLSGAAPVLILNTLNYQDGPHDFTVVAADAIGNESRFSITYYISNNGPAINLTSDTVVGSVSYTAMGTWISSGSALTSITANGVDATINNDGTWAANITLSSGFNTLSIIAKDALNNQSSLTPDVGVDLNPPAITEKTLSFLQTTYQGLYNLCNPESFVTQSTAPLCIRTDRVSLDGTAIEHILGGLDYVYLNFDVSDVVGAGVYTDFQGLTVEYSYVKNDVTVVDWTTLTTGYEDSNPATIDGYYILPITTEYLGDDWFNTSTSDNHVVTIRLKDSVGNVKTRTYTMQFDVMLYGIAPSSRSNAPSLFNQPFSSRSTINGSTVATAAIVENSTSHPIYFDFAESSNGNVVQVYESAIRENFAREISSVEWALYSGWSYTQFDTIYPHKVTLVCDNPAAINHGWYCSQGGTHYEYSWSASTISKPDSVVPATYTQIYQDQLSVNTGSFWGPLTYQSNNNTYSLSCSQYVGPVYTTPAATTYEVRYFITKSGVDLDGNNNFNPKHKAACVDRQDISVSRDVYTADYKSGYPKNTVNTINLNHSIQPANYLAYDTNDAAIISATNGYYSVEPGHIVEVRKSITLPSFTNFIGSDVADLQSFGSYTLKEYDKHITWTVDESIDLTLYASIGASPANYSVNAVNDYVIARN